MIPTDISGDSLIAQASGNTISVFLRLAKPQNGRNYPRKLGTIDVSSRVLTCTRNREKHLHLKSFSYGFNYAFIKNATKFDAVLLKERFGAERHSYLIPRDVILEEGQFLHFKSQNYELQIFLSFDKIRTYELQ